MLQEYLYNNTIENWLISLAILGVAILINVLIGFINRRYLRVLANRTKTQLDNLLVNTLETPLKVGIILIAIWVGLHRLSLSPAFDEWLYKTYKILAVLNVTWFVVHMINGVLSEFFQKRNEKRIKNQRDAQYNQHLTKIILKVSSFLIWTIGLITALNNAGLELKAILGTLGLGGIAIALASQDTVKNVFGGFTVILDGTFRIGDRIKVGAIEGEVEDIGIRSTKIRDINRQLITIPNFKVVEGAIINTSAATRSQVENKLILAADTSAAKMEEAIKILHEIAKEDNNVMNGGIIIGFSEIAAAALIIEMSYFVNRPNRRAQTVSRVNMDILKRFEAASIKLK